MRVMQDGGCTSPGDVAKAFGAGMFKKRKPVHDKK